MIASHNDDEDGSLLQSESLIKGDTRRAGLAEGTRDARPDADDVTDAAVRLSAWHRELEPSSAASAQDLDDEAIRSPTEAGKVNQTTAIKMSREITGNWHSMTQKVKTTEVAVSSVMQFTCNRLSRRFSLAIL